MAGELGRKVERSTARRELATLSAALTFAYDDKKLSQPVKVWMPEESPSRQRWLTRSEAASAAFGASPREGVSLQATLTNKIPPRKTVMHFFTADPRRQAACGSALAGRSGI